MPTLKIDGRDVTVEKGRTVIQACEQLGIEIPRYCYHPGLRVVGSCRMCLVEIEKMPKLQIACNTLVADNMVVQTQSAQVKEARRSVLEFLLLNHPLDCPVCDRAGECELQNYYMAHGQYDSRLKENKVKKKKAVAIGPHVMLDQERCVLCSRCIRFTSDVTKTGELGIFNKGTWSEVNVYPGRELNNNYSGNVVDICPVGALLDRDFRYQMSVWYLKEKFSVCPGCSTGCNIRVHYNLDRRYKIGGRRILRLKPRYNENVNGYWMCDEGRYNFDWIDENRIEHPMAKIDGTLNSVAWEGAIRTISDRLKATIQQHGPSSVAVIPSPQMTNEELYLVRKIFMEHLGIQLLHFHIPPAPNATEDKMLLKKDKNPNTKGAELILSEQRGLPVEGILDLAKSGNLKFVYVFHADLVKHFGIDAVREALGGVDHVVYQGTNHNEFEQFAWCVLPAAAYAEKEGTFTNYQGRVQRIFPAVEPLAESKPAIEILRSLGRELGVDIPTASAADVFNEMASRIPAYGNLTFAAIGLSGKLVKPEDSAVAAD